MIATAVLITVAIEESRFSALRQALNLKRKLAKVLPARARHLLAIRFSRVLRRSNDSS
jgi:hypothetical protein